MVLGKKKERKNTLYLDARAVHPLCFVWRNPFTEAQTLWNGVRKVASQLPDILSTNSRDRGKSSGSKNLANTRWAPLPGKSKHKPDFGLAAAWDLECLFQCHLVVSVGPLLFSCRMQESNPSPLPSFRDSKPDPQLIFMSPVPLIRRHSTARHMASSQLAVWAKLRLEPSSFQPRVTPPELGALCWSNKERRQASQALMSWCWSCNCLIEFAFH